MISLVLYGRNDSYGYNLHKRAAISFNCMAEVLTDPNDEILFVDCNTPNDMPTFPEAIADTLTERAKSMLRIFRVRPELFDRHKKGTRLKVLEPLSRNIAIRRSNPANRWILSTNTDMVFVPRHSVKSLGKLVADLPDRLYELPRFEVPETIWEAVDRKNPQEIIDQFKVWGERLHLNEVIVSRPEIRFDGPGDFQLMSRRQFFDINGFDEEMIWGWHVDSNICRRMFLLTGETGSLLDDLLSYHCDHTRQATAMHTSSVKTENDQYRFILNVHSPYLPQQAESWGAPDEEVEEVRLDGDEPSRLLKALEKVLPGSPEPLTWDAFSSETYNHGLLYDNQHALPFLVDHIVNLPVDNTISYFGGNPEILSLFAKSLQAISYQGRLLICDELVEPDSIRDKLDYVSTEVVGRKDAMRAADILVFDASLMQFSQFTDSNGVAFPRITQDSINWSDRLVSLFTLSARYEMSRVRDERIAPRKFLLLGAQATWFEGLAASYINIILTPYCSHLRHGFVRQVPEVTKQPGSEHKNRFALVDPYLAEVIKFTDNNDTGQNKKILTTTSELERIFDQRAFPAEPGFDPGEVEWAILHLGFLGMLDTEFLEEMRADMAPVFMNNSYVCFSNNPDLESLEGLEDHNGTYTRFVNSYVNWEEMAAFLREHRRPEEGFAAPTNFRFLFEENTYEYGNAPLDNGALCWVIVHKGLLAHINPELMRITRQQMRPVLANENYVCFTSSTKFAELDAGNVHYKFLNDWMDTYEFLSMWADPQADMVMPRELHLPAFEHVRGYDALDAATETLEWFVVHKGLLGNIPASALKTILSEMNPVHTNDLFMCFCRRKDLETLGNANIHYRYLTSWTQIGSFIQENVDNKDEIVVPADFNSIRTAIPVSYSELPADRSKQNWAVIHNFLAEDIEPGFLKHILRTFYPVAANETFTLYTRQPGFEKISPNYPQILTLLSLNRRLRHVWRIIRLGRRLFRRAIGVA